MILKPRWRQAVWAGILAVSAGAAGCKKQEPVAAASAPAPTASAPVAAKPKAEVPEPVRKLLGKWLRSDGGYVLELRSADLSGAMEAAYFNPKPIKVSRAVWMQGGGGFQVAVELNDVGYPGATYVLNYDAAADRLAGKYTQPAMQQTFDIDFIRQAKP